MEHLDPQRPTKRHLEKEEVVVDDPDALLSLVVGRDASAENYDERDASVARRDALVVARAALSVVHVVRGDHEAVDHADHVAVHYALVGVADELHFLLGVADDRAVALEHEREVEVEKGHHCLE